MGRWDAQIASAKRQIQKNGQLVTWRQVPNVVPDNTKPWKTTDGSPNDYQVYMVFLKPRLGLSSVLQFMKSTDVVQSGTRGLLAGGQLPFTPSMGDKVIRDSIQYTVKSIDPVAPSGQAIIYSVEFEGDGTPVIP